MNLISDIKHSQKITLKSGMYISTSPSRSSKDRNESYELVLYTIGNLRPFSTATAIASTTCGATCSGV